MMLEELKMGAILTTMELMDVVGNTLNRDNEVAGSEAHLLNFLEAASSYLLETWVTRDYPSGLLAMLITCSVETILSATVALTLEDLCTWKLSFNIELLAVFYTTIMAVEVVNTVQCWAFHKKGPVYVAMFKPLQMMIAAALGVVFLGDTLHLGRNTQRPPISLWLLGGFFLLGLLGSLAQIFGYVGINYSSPTLGTAMLNLVPGFTFLLAIVFRMEKLDWKSFIFVAKSAGTIISVAGALVVTLYQGPPLLRTSSAHSHHLNHLKQNSKWVLGGLFLVIDCVMASGWLILQAPILRKYPAELIVVFFYCFFVAIQCGIVTLCVERDISAWSLKPKIRLISILYSAVFGSAFQVGVSTWCLQRKGPVFVSMFKPVGVAIAVAFGVIFLDDTFYLGSLIGICTIVVGFYSVMWGKAKEEKTGKSSSQQHSRIESAPLLETKVEET